MNRFARLAMATPFLVGGLVLVAPRLRADEAPRLVPAPLTTMPRSTQAGPQSIVLSGGCFWGVQGVFQHVKGVESAVSGYAGGKQDTANYETVSTGDTRHAESVKVTYDPSQTSLGQILRIYFSVALDPTRTGGQGPDTGPQYRSAIWVDSPEQEKVARDYVAQLDQDHAWGAKLSTTVNKLPGFYPAERYHQDFLALHPDNPYIAINDIPKVEALRRLFPQDWSAAARRVYPAPPA